MLSCRARSLRGGTIIKRQLSAEDATRRGGLETAHAVMDSPSACDGSGSRARVASHQASQPNLGPCETKQSIRESTLSRWPRHWRVCLRSAVFTFCYKQPRTQPPAMLSRAITRSLPRQALRPACRHFSSSGRRADAQPAEIKKLGVIGAGQMVCALCYNQ